MVFGVFFVTLIICKLILSEFPVFIGIGQSNMAGRATIHSWDSKPIHDVYLGTNLTTWGEFKNPLNIFSNILTRESKQKLGPLWGFYQHMKNYTIFKSSIGLILNARGETGIDCWTKGNNCYDQSLLRINLFLEKFKDIKIEGILWHQGENDFDDKDYIEKLVKVIYDWRKDLNDEKLPFIAGQLVQTNPDYKMFNENIVKLKEKCKFTSVASSDGLIDRGDNIHFDWASQHLLGVRYAIEWKKIVGKVN